MAMLEHIASIAKRSWAKRHHLRWLVCDAEKFHDLSNAKPGDRANSKSARRGFGRF
jgi:hypothetical protein